MDLCIFTGRATKEPTIRTNGETKIASFSLAVDTGFGDNRKANFFNMVAFGRAADSVDKHIRQGTKIIVQCQAQQNVWTDKDGQKHYDVNFVIQSWEFAESRKVGDGQDGANGAGSYSGQGGATSVNSYSDHGSATTANSYSSRNNRTAAKTEVGEDPDFMTIADDAEEDVPFS